MGCPINQMISTISEPRNSTMTAPPGFALFRLGFRSFFLFGSLFGLGALGYFILWLSGATTAWHSAWDAVAWHQHEMLFGYAGAIIAGFLLTAVPNWTGHPTLRGKQLAALLFLWLAGRVTIFTSAYFSPLLVAVIDVSFFLACAVGILPALIKSKNRRNYFFIVLLSLLAIANGFTHWGGEENPDLIDKGIRLALNIIILMMVVIGGRVIPFFTEKSLGITIKRNSIIERFTLGFTIAALVLGVADAPQAIMGIAFLLAAAANGWRLSQWHGLKTLGTPLLWVLHAGYAWLVVGFAIAAIHNLGVSIPTMATTHAFTLGGIGVLTLGMMARVSLGHSGRPLVVGKPMRVAFVCINLAAMFRVFGVWFFPALSMRWLESAALCWLLAFGIFIVIYAPILMRPRLDGCDG